MTISDPLARVLAAGRAQFNARVAEAKHHYPALDSMAFAAFLRTSVDAVVRSVAEVAPERVAPVAVVAYDIGLELVGQALAGPGARSELIDRVWQALAPQYARLVSEQPVEVLGALTNAAVNIGKVPNARADQWIQGMTDLAKYADSVSCLRAIGQIMAWRGGLAHFRLGAIRVADQLPENVALAAVGAAAGDKWTSVRENFLADPWWAPAVEKRRALQGIEIGQFTGFGGIFRAPPEVRANAEGFCVKSFDRFSFLIADAYGAVLHPATAEEFDGSKIDLRAKTAPLKGSKLLLGGRQVELDLPEDGLAVTCNEHTIAVTSLYTFTIRLFPLL